MKKCCEQLEITFFKHSSLMEWKGGNRKENDTMVCLSACLWMVCLDLSGWSVLMNGLDGWMVLDGA
jgi:hypothetical protein